MKDRLFIVGLETGGIVDQPLIKYTDMEVINSDTPDNADKLKEETEL